MRKFQYVILLIILTLGCKEEKTNNEDRGLALSKAMGSSETSDFQRAVDIKEFKFPNDHGPHPDFRTEWWYFTGNLSSLNNRNFGYQFTIFRTALTSNKTIRKSNWNSNQIYMGHFALTDIERGEFYFDERFSREGNGLSGSKALPFKVWIEDWEITQINDSSSYGLPLILLKANLDNVEVQFRIEALKPLVLQGDKGLSQKGKQPGNASYYYSYTRLKTEGSISLNGEDFNVAGNSWMDREWSTSALDSNQVGWDWFALQLNNKTELMYYQLRNNDGTPDLFSKGVLVDEYGNVEIIRMNQINLRVTETWESPKGSTYPSGWNLRIPDKNINLDISPGIKNQLMDVSVKYWEGSVQITGEINDEDISGYGYVELTGY